MKTINIISTDPNLYWTKIGLGYNESLSPRNTYSIIYLIDDKLMNRDNEYVITSALTGLIKYFRRNNSVTDGIPKNKVNMGHPKNIELFKNIPNIKTDNVIENIITILHKTTIYRIIEDENIYDLYVISKKPSQDNKIKKRNKAEGW